MGKKRSLIDYALISLKGIGMGAADVVPGVSGGTIAFITGIYEELLDTINKANLKSLRILKSDGVKTFWKHINGNFIVALFLGIGISIISLAKVATYFMENNPIPLWSFFFGLVIASIFYVGNQVEKWKSGTIIGFVMGAAVAYGITTLEPVAASGSYPFLFLSGMIAICAMILPGISGSFILLLLGAYQTVMAAVSDKDFVILGVVAAGCLVGLLSFSRVLKWLFEKYKDLTIAILSGFLLGSLNKIWPWKRVDEIYVKHAGEIDESVVALKESNVLPDGYQTFEYANSEITRYVDADGQLGLAVICFLVGLGIIFGMEFAAKKLQK